ncbi:MAG TPA: CHAD domain-containing protein [Candidatus Limnocylindrales bacterium]|nr:CHAD domain-containing protein [Candidatus Limnocylindrales bacterium]
MTEGVNPVDEGTAAGRHPRPMEVELKYRMSSVAAGERLLFAGELAGLYARTPITDVHAEDRYLDTPDAALAAAGYAGRLRRTGTGTVITLKGLKRQDDGGAAHRREELEGPADPDLPPSAWPESAARDAVTAIVGDRPLDERVVLRQVRRKRLYGFEGTVVELSLDDVEVVSEGRVIDRFAELEAELVEGSEGALGRLAELLGEREELVPIATSKLDRAMEAVRREQAARLDGHEDDGDIDDEGIDGEDVPEDRASLDADLAVPEATIEEELAVGLEGHDDDADSDDADADDETPLDDDLEDAGDDPLLAVDQEPDPFAVDREPRRPNPAVAAAVAAVVAREAAAPHPAASSHATGPAAAQTATTRSEPAIEPDPGPFSVAAQPPEVPRDEGAVSLAATDDEQADEATQSGTAAPAGHAPVTAPASDASRAPESPEPRAEPPKAPKPEPRLSAGKTPGVLTEDHLAEAGRKVLRFHLARMVTREAGTREGKDNEELHGMRVATRRQRAAWRVFGVAFDQKRTGRHQRRLKEVARDLGAVRDLDVLIEAAEAYQQGLPARERGNFEPLIAKWRGQRDAARVVLIKELDSDRYQRWVDEYIAFVQAEGIGTRPVGPVEPHRVRDTMPSRIWAAYEGVRAYEPVMRWADVTTLHDLRIAAKWLRYTLEFVREALGPESAPVIERVVALQDHLGWLHDADVAAGLARAFLVEHAGDLSEAESAAIGRYLVDRERELARLRRTVGPTWRGVASLGFRRALGRLVAGL